MGSEVHRMTDINKDEVEVWLLVCDGGLKRRYTVDVSSDSQIIGKLFYLKAHT